MLKNRALSHHKKQLNKVQGSVLQLASSGNIYIGLYIKGYVKQASVTYRRCPCLQGFLL